MNRRSQKRMELANRVIALAGGARIPMTFRELAQLVKMMKTPEEKALPLEEIAAIVIRRESFDGNSGKRKGRVS